MKNILAWLAGLLLLLIFSPAASAQMTESQRGNLLRISEQYQGQEASRRLEVEDFARRQNIPLEVRDSNRQIVAILDRIENGQPIYIGDDNVVSQGSLSADDLKAGGGLRLNLTGAGQTLGIWEAGGTVRTTHQEFGGRVVNLDGTANTDHATHVAGTMIAAGVDPAARGFAEAANLRCYDAGGDLGEMAAEAAAATPIRVSNHSYGDFAGWDFDNTVMPNVWRWFGNSGDVTDWKFGAYDADAQGWDNVAFNAPFYLVVKSAGNDRNDAGPAAGTTYNLGFSASTSMAFRNPDGGATGFDCIPTAGNAKNILTVGAVNPVPGGNGYTGPNSVTMSTFSGWGPTDDGRIKPDVVADGVGLYSCVGTGDSDYDTFSGTSMAAPSTAGTVGLLLEHWQNELGGVPRAATMKALLINEADEIGPADGPDYSFGWGQVNAADAAQLITFDSYEGCEHIVQGSVAAGATFSYTVHSSGSQPLKISLVWSDPPSGTTNGGTVNPAGVNYLVNDLDLRLDGSSSTFSPWILDPANPANAATTGNNNRDNVEQILLLNPTEETYTVRVVAPAALTDGPQQFSLVLSGNDASVDNATFSSLTISDERVYAARQSLTFGPDFIVTNSGDVKGYAGQSIHLVPGGLVTGFHAQPGSRFLARILPGGGCGIFSGDLKADNYTGSKAVAEARETDVFNEKTEVYPADNDFQISPNPATDVFTVRFHATKDAPVNLWLLNAQGQAVQTLLSNSTYEDGVSATTFPTGNLMPGQYFCVLQSGSQRSAKPLIIVKN